MTDLHDLFDEAFPAAVAAEVGTPPSTPLATDEDGWTRWLTWTTETGTVTFTQHSGPAESTYSTTTTDHTGAVSSQAEHDTAEAALAHLTTTLNT